MKVAFDIGGTFTDVVLLHDDGRVATAKTLSVMGTLASDIARIVEADGVGGAAGVDGFVHATTVCSNALIEGTTPPVALVTTRGFRSVLQMMDQRGPEEYRVDWDRPAPLVPLRLCFEVDERILADGTVDRPVAGDDLRALVAAVRSAPAVEAVAVCLVNAYVDGRHEDEVRAALASAVPELPVCTSSDVDPAIKEYERTSTTVINAALTPIVRAYLDDLERGLGRFGSDIRIMQSNGGTMATSLARVRPMTMVESGPAAGALAAAHVARELQLDSVLSFDMGGTTAKACLIEDGRPLEKPGMEVGGAVAAGRLRSHGHPLRTPSIDLVEVGAGGGSIAWIDGAGALRVGPQSAGAEPGPACYGRGGTAPTVTDANVVLGYINPDLIAGDTLALDRDAAVRAIESQVASPLGLDVMEAAHGIVSVANASMMRALRAVSTERGRDMRSLTLIAFGGSGPLHAVSLCEAVGIDRVVVPPHSGVLSAVGLLLAGDRLDVMTTLESPLGLATPHEVRGAFDRMAAEAGRTLGAGSPAGDPVFDCMVDLRYSFEPTELTLPVDPHRLDVEELAGRFKVDHERELGFVGAGEVTVARVRMRATGAAATRTLRMADDPAASAKVGGGDRTRQAYFGPGHGLVTATVLSGSRIGPAPRSGPLVIEEATTTVVVPPGWSAAPTGDGYLVIDRVGSDQVDVNRPRRRDRAHQEE